jgi:hypothetical protein
MDEKAFEALMDALAEKLGEDLLKLNEDLKAQEGKLAKIKEMLI